jgi:hypothetical protein
MRGLSLSLALAGVLGSLSLGASSYAEAGVSMLQPPKRIDATKPLTLTLLVSEDEQAQHTYQLPETILVAASADMIPPVQITLTRDAASESEISLKKGEFRKVAYRGTLPERLRGMVRIEPIGLDASPILVAVIRPDANMPPLATAPDLLNAPLADSSSKTAPVAPGASVVTPGSNAISSASAPAAEDLFNASRLSFNEPMYFSVGNSGGNRNAKFQLSFKYRLFLPQDPRSRGFLDNLYLGYTQFSLWDLSAPSAPFRDTNYRPSVYYFLPDLGIQNSVISRMSIATGLEHESNGRDGTESRGVNTYFVQPTVNFGNLNDYHLSIAPKVYAYLGPLRDNPDIADYRGHVDLKLAFGKPDGVEFSTMLRKGSRSNYGSVDSQLSYPMSKLIPGTAGYLVASYF